MGRSHTERQLWLSNPPRPTSRDRASPLGRHMTSSRSSPRFFLGFRETAGYLARLRDGLDALGIEAMAVDVSGHPFGYQSRGWWVAPSLRLAKRRARSTGLQRGVWRALQWMLTA